MDDFSLIKCETVRIHPSSDLFEPTENYIGLIDFLTGDIYIKQSDWILRNIPQRLGRQDGTYLHGRLYYFIYKQWKKEKQSFLGRGFSYLDGEWKSHSQTLNNSHNEFEQKLLQIIIDNLYINHRWIEIPPNYRIDSRELVIKERHQKYSSQVHPSQVHVKRRLHGTIKWLDDSCHRIGVIQCLGLDRDFSIHSLSIPNSLSFSGNNIEFTLVEEANQWKIKHATLIWP